MTDNLPNRDEELPVSGRRYPHEDPQGRLWSEVLEDAIEELNAHTTVSGAPRSEFDHVEGMIYVPRDADDAPLSISDGTSWINLEELIDADGSGGSGDGSLTAFDSDVELGDFTELEAGDDISGTLDDDRLTLDSLADGNGSDNGAGVTSWDVLVLHESVNGDHGVYGDDGDLIVSSGSGSTAIQAAVDNCPQDGVVLIGLGEYVFDSQVEFPHGMTFRGLGRPVFDTDPLDDATYALFHDSGYSTVSLGSDIDHMDYVLDVADSSGIEIGDIVIISTEQIFFDGSSRTNYAGEAHKVKNVDEVDADTVTLDQHIVYPPGYDAVGAELRVVKPEEFHFRDFTIEGGAGVSSEDDSSDVPSWTGMDIRGMLESTVERVHIRHTNDTGFRTRRSVDVTFRDCLFEHMQQPSDGYGLQLNQGCANIDVVNCRLRNCRHAFSITSTSDYSAPVRAITLRDCWITGDQSSLVNHHDGSCYDFKIVDCVLANDDRESDTATPDTGRAAIRLGCWRAVVRGCEIYAGPNGNQFPIGDRGGSTAVDVEWYISDTDVHTGRYAVTPTSGRGDWTMGSLVLDNLRVHGEPDGIARFDVNTIDYFKMTDCSAEAGVGVLVRSCDIAEALVVNNRFGPCGDHHIEVQSDGSVDRCRIADNKFTDPGGDFFDLYNATNWYVSGNDFDDPNSNASDIVVERSGSGDNTWTLNHLLDVADSWDVDSSSTVENNY